MKTLFTVLFCVIGVTSFAQSIIVDHPDYVPMPNVYLDDLLDRMSIDTASFDNDTIPGWALVTDGPQCPAKQVFAYQVRYAYLYRGNDIYLDAYKLPLNRNVIVWDFRPREERRRQR